MGVGSRLVRWSEMVCTDEGGDYGLCWIGSYDVVISGWLVEVVVGWIDSVFWDDGGGWGWNGDACYYGIDSFVIC